MTHLSILNLLNKSLGHCFHLIVDAICRSVIIQWHSLSVVSSQVSLGIWSVLRVNYIWSQDNYLNCETWCWPSSVLRVTECLGWHWLSSVVFRPLAPARTSVHTQQTGYIQNTRPGKIVREPNTTTSIFYMCDDILLIRVVFVIASSCCDSLR